MPKFRCLRCGKPKAHFEFESDTGACPQCGHISACELADIHYVVMDQSGPIYSPLGMQYIACQPKRDHMAEHTFDNFAATGDPRQVTCRSCMTTPMWRAHAQYEAKMPGNGAREWARKLVKILAGG